MKNQTFGIEIEMNHITRQRAAQVVAETLGEGATFRHTGGAYDAWEVTAPDGRRWKLVSDASMKNTICFQHINLKEEMLCLVDAEKWDVVQL